MRTVLILEGLLVKDAHRKTCVPLVPLPLFYVAFVFNLSAHWDKQKKHVDFTCSYYDIKTSLTPAAW